MPARFRSRRPSDGSPGEVEGQSLDEPQFRVFLGSLRLQRPVIGIEPGVGALGLAESVVVIGRIILDL
jgi:hypothetical protein